MTRTKVAIVAMLVLALSVGGAAEARNERDSSDASISTLSMAARALDTKIKAKGSYLPPAKVPECPAGGRTVMMLGDAAASGTTNPVGVYNIQTGKLPGGSYTIYTHVDGVMDGPYGGTVICTDANSDSQTVTVP